MDKTGVLDSSGLQKACHGISLSPCREGALIRKDANLLVSG